MFLDEGVRISKRYKTFFNESTVVAAFVIPLLNGRIPSKAVRETGERDRAAAATPFIPSAYQKAGQDLNVHLCPRAQPGKGEEQRVPVVTPGAMGHC